MNKPNSPGPLSGIRVVDLTRVLAGPSATQMLGDLGAEIIKIEKPGAGDDTRKWGPPYLKDTDGNDTTESAYYLSTNRNKWSLAVDISRSAGQALVTQIAQRSHILVENFKTGSLSKYGLSYEILRSAAPRLVYCSITGFGQTGPESHRAGYDYLAQALSGLMSVTGDPEGPPVKVGIATADLYTGLYSTIAILAALRHAEKTGDGQHVELSLLDSQIAAMSYQAAYYRVSGEVPDRMGNEHPTIVPYSTFACSDGEYIALAVGNDAQFQKVCAFAGRDDLATDTRFQTNDLRVRNRKALMPLLIKMFIEHPGDHWVKGFDPLGVPCSRVNKLDQVFADPQVQAREMDLTMPYPGSDMGTVNLVGSPIKMSRTPVSYRFPPPTLGQQTQQVLNDLLGMKDEEIDHLRATGVVG